MDTREDILPPSIQGIPTNSNDHGIMVHVEVQGTPEHPEDGFTHVGYEEGKFTENRNIHVQKDFNITFQEWDYKPDGTPKKIKGKVVCTAMNVKPGAKLTLVWTKKVDWTNPDKDKPQAEWAWCNTEEVRNADGSGVQIEGADGNKTWKRQLIPDRHYKPGDTEILTTPTKTLENKKENGGTITLPRDFCGYVIIPFSAFQLTWNGSADFDHKLNFKKMELANIYTGSYCYHRGTLIFDEYSFWGPTFAKVDGAYDYGNISIKNHKDCLINRKRINVKPEKPVEEPSKEAPAVIKKDVTLTNKKTGIVIEAPSSAKLNSKMVFNVDVVNPNETDYAKQLYEKLFGKDKIPFKSYNLYLGADGDQEPADFVQINFPVPEGMNADACKVYTISDDAEVDKVLVDSKLSEDKKTISIKVNKLGVYIIAEAGNASGEASEETTEEVSESEDVNEPVSEDASEESSEAEKKTANLTWLWIVLGVAAAAVIAVVVVLVVKKNKKEDAPEENSDDTPEEK